MRPPELETLRPTELQDFAQVGDRTSPATATRSRLAPKHRGVADSCYETLRSQLITAMLRPGARLSARAVAAELRVSRTSAQTALGRLANESLVRRLESGVFEVAALDSAEISNLYACRAALEGLAARLVVERASLQDVDALQESIEQAGRAYVRGDALCVVECNARFHRRLVENAKNQPLESALGSIAAHFEGFRMALSVDARLPLFVSEHQAIVDALRARASDEAERAVRSHMASVASRVRASAAVQSS